MREERVRERKKGGEGRRDGEKGQKWCDERRDTRKWIRRDERRVKNRHGGIRVVRVEDVKEEGKKRGGEKG